MGITLLVAIICAVHQLLMARHQAVLSPVLLIGGVENKAGLSKYNRLLNKPANNSYLVHSMKKPRSREKHRKAKPVMVSLSSNLPTLPPDVIRGINFFSFFVGYPRSGHSIVGSILDAHPHIVMSHELKFFEQGSFFNTKSTQRAWTANLYNIIYQRSIKNTQTGGLRNVNSTLKGYTLAIDSLWQGKFDKYIQVLGDKSGGSATLEYIRDRITFQSRYQELVEKIGIPIKVLHVLRNPYDVIATRLLYTVGRQSKYKRGADFVVGVKKHVGNITTNTRDRENAKINNYIILENKIKTYFVMNKAVTGLIELFGTNNVLDIHIRDLIHNPKDTILSLSGFLGVDAEDRYVQLCAEKIYKTTSHSRNLVVWPPELRMMVEHGMKEYKILHGYNFTSD